MTSMQAPANSPRFSTLQILAFLAALMLLVLFGRFPSSGLWAGRVADGMHGPVFAVVAAVIVLLLGRLERPRLPLLAAGVVAFVVAVALGGGIELLQLRLGGDASWEDLLHDAEGAVAGIAFLAWSGPQRLRSAAARAIALVIVIVCSVLVLMPILVTAGAYGERYVRFPTLVDFDSPFSRYFVEGYSAIDIERARPPAGAPDNADDEVGLHARLQGRRGWGLVLWEPSADWRRMDRLMIDLVNPTDDPLGVRVRIRDTLQGHDADTGFVDMVSVPPHSRRVWKIKLSRLIEAEGTARVNVSRVASIEFNKKPGSLAQEFYLMGIWLDR